MKLRFAVGSAWIALLSCTAYADEPALPDLGEPDKSGYTLFDPTPDDLMRKFTPDRPTKGFSVRTVDAGHFEVETDLVNYSYSNGSSAESVGSFWLR
jgi:hypothetical protein